MAKPREWLKTKREESGKTMKDMAAELGISESYYSYIEAGVRQKRMDLSLVAKISQIFSMTVQQIVEYEVGKSK